MGKTSCLGSDGICTMDAPQQQVASDVRGLTFCWTTPEVSLFSNAEGTKNQVQNVIGSRGAGDGIKRTKGVVEIEQQHFVWHSSGHSIRGSAKCGKRFLHQPLMTDVGQKTRLDVGGGAAADVAQNLSAQFRDSFSSQGRDANASRPTTDR